MTYTHLTQNERYQIQALRTVGRSIRAIAVQLNRSVSTISRELAHHGGASPYLAAAAQEQACQRLRHCRNATAIGPQLWGEVIRLLRLDLSPDQVRNRLREEGSPTVSHEAIYQFVYNDKALGGTLVSHLRCQKERRKRYASGRDRRGHLKDRVGIDHRPAIVETRSRIGDWEVDTVIGVRNSGVFLTAIERHTRLCVVRWLPNREAEPISAALIEMLRPYREQCLTITMDNGKEFADHVFFGECLQAQVYFARPYHSWERGSIENCNGLLRQYFPKKSSFSDVTPEQVEQAVNRLNNRPRKCLGYRTPNEVFYDSPMTTLQ